jgi:condensin complex subunit 1
MVRDVCIAMGTVSRSHQPLALLPPDPVQWREIAFCLSQLQLSDRSVRGLVENFRQYKHTLSDATVCDTFRALAGKARKSGLGKGELKEAIVEWEKQIVAASGGTREEDVEGEDEKDVETLAADLQAVAVA